ncbi:hypothetical protein CI109_100349 [Kwoniella shandongensis]|uniref:Uncharacterized protein n=1 Tax=Kwoniella shandongensis TaxID=1734106 RepID=A0A5M6C8X3_9TREE|nr:uncharacterized protein CI109_001805 [Kwoniella shandongensis]KAA5529865.1 hypothetical protein CI109_001805 [Kwoniella shandongensis]
MPSVLSPTSTSSKSYAPLADEINPSFGNTAPSVTRNGTIVYSKRSVSSTSTTSTDSDDLERVGAQLRNDSEETLSPRPSRKGKERARMNSLMEEGDIGEMRRMSVKGKERAWDVEQGREEEFEQNAGQYPPLNETEEEEKRIQDNLARIAAKEAAKRKAARESRILPSSPNPSSSSSRRPFSLVESVSKRGSIMGLVEGIWPGSPRKDASDGELPTVNPPRGADAPYANPYDPQPAFPPVPRMVISPTSPPNPSPFDDPADPRPTVVPSQSYTSQRRPSLTTSTPTTSPLASPTDGVGFSYSGPTWRGGQAVQQDDGTAQLPPRRVEKWWHALCAWGSDLDGGHGDQVQGRQAGRTNPFE